MVAKTKEPTFQREEPVFFAGADLHKVKQDRIRAALNNSEYDALLFFKAEAVRYITDFYVKGYRPFMEPEYFVLVTKNAPPAVGYVSGSDDLRIRYKSYIEDARKLPGVSDWAKVIGPMIADYGLSNARIGTDLMPFMIHTDLTEQHQGLEIVNASQFWSEVTSIKHPLEIELIREAVRVADIGAVTAMNNVREGISEHRVAAEAIAEMRRNGSEFEPFIPLVASGYNTSMFERVATEKLIQNGETVIIDIGAVVRGYTGDLGRTIICGNASSEQKAIYRVVYDALNEAKKLVKPGVLGSTIDARAREVISEAGWADYLYSGNTGHQLGFGLHGEPLVDRGVDFEIKENMVMCLEPRIVLPDRPDIGGVHLEDVVHVTSDGHRQLNSTPHCQELLQ